jgi:hypothetical protein
MRLNPRHPPQNCRTSPRAAPVAVGSGYRCPGAEEEWREGLEGVTPAIPVLTIRALIAHRLGPRQLTRASDQGNTSDQSNTLA